VGFAVERRCAALHFSIFLRFPVCDAVRYFRVAYTLLGIALVTVGRLILYNGIKVRVELTAEGCN